MAKNGISSALRASLPAVLAELVGTALLLLAGCMAQVPAVGATPPTLLFNALSFGLTVMSIIQIFGHVSGAHLNPAVTLAAVLSRTLSPMLAVAFVVAQVVGAISGFGLLRALTPYNLMYPDGLAPVCCTVPHPDISTLQALAVEVFASAVLVLVNLALWEPVHQHNQDSAPLKIGLVVTVLSMVAGPYTGASMNPARSLAPAIWNSEWDRLWIYWLGPLCSSAIATLVFRLLFRSPATSPQSDRLSQRDFLQKREDGDAAAA